MRDISYERLPQISATVLAVTLAGLGLGTGVIPSPISGPVIASAAGPKAPDPTAVTVIQFDAATKQFRQYGEPKDKPKATELNAVTATVDKLRAVSTGRPIRIRIVNPNSFAESYKIEALGVDFHRVDLSKFAAHFPGISDFLSTARSVLTPEGISDAEMPRINGYPALYKAVNDFVSAKKALEKELPTPQNLAKWKSIKTNIDLRIATASTADKISIDNFTQNPVLSNATIRAAVAVEVKKQTGHLAIEATIKSDDPYSDLSDKARNQILFAANDLSKNASGKIDRIQPLLDAYHVAQDQVKVEYEAAKPDIENAIMNSADAVKKLQDDADKAKKDAETAQATVATAKAKEAVTKAADKTGKTEAINARVAAVAASTEADKANTEATQKLVTAQTDAQRARGISAAAIHVSEQVSGDEAGTRAAKAISSITTVITDGINPTIKLVKSVMSKTVAPTYLEKQIDAQDDRIDIKVTVTALSADKTVAAVDPGADAPAAKKAGTTDTAATPDTTGTGNETSTALIDAPGDFSISTYPYSLPISKRWVVDTSGGLVVTFSRRETFGQRTEVTGSGQTQHVVRRTGRNNADGDLGIFVHYYRTNPSGWAFGPALGLVPASTSSIKSYLPGISLIRGQENRLILTVGAAITTVDTLSGVSVGDVITTDTPPMRKSQKLSPFVSLSFQITRF